MPFFDDPKGDLQWLEKELLATEQEEASNDSFNDNEFDEYGDFDNAPYDEEEEFIGELKDLLQEPREIPRRSKSRRETDYIPQEHESDPRDVYYREDYKADRKAQKKQQRKKKGNGCLIWIIVMELAAIAALAVWWYLWLT